MKRQYVKPMMESEAFVANEYVAACWTVTCGGNPAAQIPPCGVEKFYEEPKTENGVYFGTIGTGEYKNGCYTTEGENYPTWFKFLYLIFTGRWLNDKEPVSYHNVTVASDGWDNHPKASV